ncbi:MAG: polyprenyl synthetase family protein [Dehalococcoidia bacterium]|jgi:octaprenyl-diphosphate synthase|nr:heptaprenyl diphosphate synthase [Chloroflexota bacterium]MCH2494209.1 polyprenyl synthetase family protein [Dehalococcoidia bacterium]MQF84075.1 polyprenyl synthetase family protein [SAR202 cluster bacterium]MEC7919609.1 polyprenyl synthetase family protein [Chloroflexota bacterium]MEC9098558.1 polyprenyl synthetase family protein [Chloroflexota bacterium]|tara:strand:+ start:3391 stop:4383 length:993 start_codon:yes stop_codon:yes gene_type:complete
MNKNKEISNLANNELLLVMLELNKISEQHNTESNLNENIINHVLSIPGKQLRPSMTIISSKIWNEDVDYKVIKMATAVELLHIATLVHDDTVDFADTRRGEKTASNIWGPHIAVLVGDFLFATSAEYVCDTESIRLIKQFASTISDLAKGELKEIENSNNVDSKVEDYLDIIFKKTGSLFATSSMSGALLGGAKEKDINTLYSFGKNLGLGFQIFDDILDFEGDENQLGKPVGNDLKNGIMTYPSLLARDRNKNIKKDIEELFNLPKNKREDAVTSVVKEIKSSGFIDESISKASKIIEKAIEDLESVQKKNIFIDSLIDLAKFSMNRDK